MGNLSDGKWIALKSNEYFENGKVLRLYEPDEDDKTEMAYTKIVTESGKTVVTNHDMFEFRSKEDAILISKAPELLKMLESILNHADNNLIDLSAAGYIRHELRQLINEAKGEEQ